MTVPKNIDGESKTQGKYMVSIGTSLALETLFGINDNVPPTQPLPFTSYKYIFVNVRTLLRNLHGAVLKELKIEWANRHYLEELIKEISIIPEIIADQSGQQMGVVLYLPKYSSMEREYPKAAFKEVKGLNNVVYSNMESFVIRQLINKVQNKELNIMLVDMTIPLPDEKIILMTHNPIDLLPYARSQRLDLIESHTGTIKDRTKWYTKLSGKELERIPFGKFSIQVFGDGKVFKGLPSIYRNAILQLADKQKWNQLTSDDLIKMTLNKIENKEVIPALRELL